MYAVVSKQSHVFIFVLTRIWISVPKLFCFYMSLEQEHFLLHLSSCLLLNVPLKILWSLLYSRSYAKESYILHSVLFGGCCFFLKSCWLEHWSYAKDCEMPLIVPPCLCVVQWTLCSFSQMVQPIWAGHTQWKGQDLPGSGQVLFVLIKNISSVGNDHKAGTKMGFQSKS